MKKILAIVIALSMSFSIIWVAKAKTPIMRPSSYGENTDPNEGVWWNLSNIESVDDNWILDPEIPENYLPVPGLSEVYMVLDEDGKITQYRKREKQEDGSWVWSDTNPDIPDDYEPVDGLEDVYKVTAQDGTVKYLKYIRNDDNTYAFVEVDKNGKTIETAPPTDSSIPSNYIHVSKNIYAVLNEYGVIIGYKERLLNEDGSYKWIDAEKPKTSSGSSNTSYNSNQTNQNNTQKPNNSTSNNSSGGNVIIPGSNGGNSNNNVVTNSDGTYTETEVIYSEETSGGWTTKYQTIVTRVYDAKGLLISTKKDGPNVISKTQANGENTQAPNPNNIASTLKAEVARVNVGVNYRTDLAQAVLSKLNAERASEGLTPLKMNAGSDACLIAQARAAAMAKYNYSDYDSPLYGTLPQMLKCFGISSAVPSENTWKTVASKSADDIHLRFMALDGARGARMSSQYTNVGIAIAQKNGYYYICEIYLN